MIERLLLTPDFVNQASPPVRGERWIADAKLRGFGLRLWQTKQGEGKAYAVRTVGKRGRSIRRTYDGEARNEFSPVTGERRSLGDVLEEAREWAADEICRAKGKPTLRQEKDEHRRRFSRRISRLTLDDLARARIRGMLVRGLTESYIDRLTKLYHQYVALKLRQTRISKLKPRALAKTFQALNEKPGSARTLRSFLGQVVKDASFYCLPLFRAFYFDRLPANPSKEHPYEIKDRYPKEIFAKIFAELDRFETNWIQAQFIRLLFEFKVPADRLMRAKWDHIANGRWYPWLRDERKYWWVHSRNVDPTINLLLQNLRACAEKECGSSPFSFPISIELHGTHSDV